VKVDEEAEQGKENNEEEDDYEEEEDDDESEGSDWEEEHCSKKAKVESQPNSSCDTDSEPEPVCGLLGEGGYPSPFPSPDHNYAISPVKGEAADVKVEAVEEEDVKHEPDEEKEEEPPSRYRVGPSQVCSIFKSFSTFSFGSRRNADTRSWMRNIF
jgi:hypothetical protein